MNETIHIPENVTATVDRFDLSIEGPNGRVKRRLWYPDVTVQADGDTIVIESDDTNAKTEAIVGTFVSHIHNMIHGVTEGFEYSMEVFYSHFPMQVNVEDGHVVIENFLGERSPRRTPIHGATEVDIDGETLTIRGPDIEDVGQTAADIEQMTRINDKDTRVFQDGVYITEKPTRGDV